MKPVDTKDLLGSGKKDDFSQTVATVQTESSTIVRKTYTLEQRHVDQINATAGALSQQQGKLVNASEALRYLLDRMKGADAT